MKELLEIPKVIQAKDQCGRCPLHIAVLSDQKDIVEHIITNHPASVQATDNVSTIRCFPSTNQMCTVRQNLM